MTDVFLLLASLAVVALGTALVVLQRRTAVVRRRRELTRRERWLTSDEYISRVNAAQTDEDLRRAQEGSEQGLQKWDYSYSPSSSPSSA